MAVFPDTMEYNGAHYKKISFLEFSKMPLHTFYGRSVAFAYKKDDTIAYRSERPRVLEEGVLAEQWTFAKGEYKIFITMPPVLYNENDNAVYITDPPIDNILPAALIAQRI